MKHSIFIFLNPDKPARRGTGRNQKAEAKRRLTQSRKGRKGNLYVSVLKPNDLVFLCELSDFARNFLPILKRICFVTD
jgi:hypothetical protein